MITNKNFTEEVLTIINESSLIRYFSDNIGLDVDDLGDIEAEKFIWGNNFVERLSSIIRYHEILYAKGESIILDEDFDKLYMGLQEIEENYSQFILAHSPTQVLFSDFEVKDGDLVKLSYPSKSLAKCNDYKGLKTKIKGLLKRIDTSDSKMKTILAQHKDDGLTINLDYSRGRLVQAATRGQHGVEGYDILEFVKLMPSIPKEIDFYGDLSIKGEGIASLESMLEVNESLAEEDKYTQLRQFISSTFGSGRDISEVVRRNIFYSAYEIYNSKNESYREDMEFLKSLGFRTSPAHVFKTKGKNLDELTDEIYSYILDFEENVRETIDHEIDGLVFRPLSNKVFLDAGVGTKVVNGGFAYKFTTFKAHAQMIDIELNLGVTGRLSYTGITEPVLVKDSTIRRFTIDNYSFIEEFGLNKNSKVIIEKAGDIIPKLHSAIKTDEPIFEMPTNCPFCNEPLSLEISEKTEYQYCRNKNCDERAIQELIGFTSRGGGLDIPSLGESSIRVLYNNGLLKKIPDLYELKNKEDELLKLPRFGKRSVKKLLNGIEDSKSAGGIKVLSSLHKYSFGKFISELLLRKYHSFDELLDEYNNNQEDLFKWMLEQEKVGPKTIEVVKTFLEDEEIIDMLNTLKSYGVVLSEDEIDEILSEKSEPGDTSNPLYGKSICFTGKMSRVRSDLEEMAKVVGAAPVRTVTKSLDILILADVNSTSSKAKKARENGTQLMSESEFLTYV